MTNLPYFLCRQHKVKGTLLTSIGFDTYNGCRTGAFLRTLRSVWCGKFINAFSFFLKGNMRSVIL